MKVLLYFENEKQISSSGIGRALSHQLMACKSAGIETTTDPNCEDYDILHINTVGINSNNMVKKARTLQKKVIYHAHSTEEDFRNSFILSNQVAPLFKLYISNLYSSADYILTPTSYSKKLLENYGIQVPIEAISNGVDLKTFEYNKEKVLAYKRYFSLKDDDKVVMSVGWFFERKGILDFIEIARSFPNVKFIWFGELPNVTTPKHIKEAVANAGDNVIFPGYVKGPIIQGAYSCADIFFFPSYEETEGIVVLEAFASRAQVVVRDIGVYEDWLYDGKSCYKGNSNDEFKRIISQLLNHQLPSTTENGYISAQHRSIEAVGQHLKQIYQKVMDMPLREKGEFRDKL